MRLVLAFLNSCSLEILGRKPQLHGMLLCILDSVDGCSRIIAPFKEVSEHVVAAIFGVT